MFSHRMLVHGDAPVTYCSTPFVSCNKVRPLPLKCLIIYPFLETLNGLSRLSG